MFDEMKTKVSPCEREIKFAVSDIIYSLFIFPHVQMWKPCPSVLVDRYSRSTIGLAKFPNEARTKIDVETIQ
jgi:hypothetical protein